MKRISSLLAFITLISTPFAYASGSATVKLHCASKLHYTCKIINAQGDFSSNCDLNKDFLDTYYEGRALKDEYKAQVPLSIPSVSPYPCSDGNTHFSDVTLTIEPGQSQKQTVKTPTCQPDTMEQNISFTVVNGPVNVAILAASNSSVSPNPAAAMKSYDTGTYQVAWKQAMNGSSDGCAYAVAFDFSVPAAVSPAQGSAPVVVPAPVPILPVTTP